LTRFGTFPQIQIVSYLRTIINYSPNIQNVFENSKCFLKNLQSEIKNQIPNLPIQIEVLF